MPLSDVESSSSILFFYCASISVGMIEILQRTKKCTHTLELSNESVSGRAKFKMIGRWKYFHSCDREVESIVDLNIGHTHTLKILIYKEKSDLRGQSKLFKI